MKDYIYHICLRTDWESAQKAGVYVGDTFATEGFIHCSSRTQTAPTANSFFAGQSGLVVLEIDPERLDANLVYEDTADAGQDFPHIYGELNLNAIVAVHDFEPGSDGKFTSQEL